MYCCPAVGLNRVSEKWLSESTCLTIFWVLLSVQTNEYLEAESHWGKVTKRKSSQVAGPLELNNRVESMLT